MTKDNPNTFKAFRLTEARIAKGLTMSELAEKIDVTRQAISRYENGVKPNGDNIAKLSRVLECPISFFTKPSKINKAKSEIFFRKYATAKKLKLKIEQAEIKSDWAQENIEIVQEFVQFPKINLPQFEKSADELQLDEIETIANQLRKEWGLGLGIIPNLTKLLESNGVIIIKNDFEYKDIDGYSFYNLESGRPFIFLTDNQKSAVHSRFSIAHELGHLVLHCGAKIHDKDSYKTLEKQANRFAGAFLLPSESFCNEIISTSLEYLIELKRKWKVSLATIIYRCKDLDILNDNQASHLFRTLRSTYGGKKEPLDDIIEEEKSTLLHKSLDMIVNNAIMTKQEFCEKARFYDYVIEKICDLEKDYLSKEKNIDNILYLKNIK